MRRVFVYASAVGALVALFCCNDPYASTDAPADAGSGDGATIDDSASASDAANGADGSLADARDPDAGCARFADAEFCDDFDQPKSLSPSTWTTFDDEPVDGGTKTIGLVSDDRVSKPFAAGFMQKNVGNCGFLRAIRVFPGSRTALRARLSVRAKTPGIFVTLESTVNALSSWCGVHAAFEDATRIRLERDRKDTNGNVVAAEVKLVQLATSAFVDWIDVELELNTFTRYATLRLGNGQGADMPIPTDVTLSESRIGIGPTCAGDTDLRIDDVAVFTTP